MENQSELATEPLSENMSSGEHALYDLLFPEDNQKNKITSTGSLPYLQELNALHIDRLQLEVSFTFV